ncbi:hypothetical protein TcasGA2_TC001221 [Tribolium castaneum]|uniref:Uncharacterized protein n=1 Tax=Tribolium castaneum TaxID=7070 RepID=D6WAU6_TRICA|nr:hypothetical protein TcasGA2_TC001221 [Tribolium castaneum]
MYTNPFNRTHCTIRQIIDKFLHVDNGSRSYKNSLKRSTSNCSDTSYSSCSSKKSNSSTGSIKTPSFHRKYGRDKELASWKDLLILPLMHSWTKKAEDSSATRLWNFYLFI